MEAIIPFYTEDVAKITNHRSGEIKFGEKMITLPKNEDIFTFLKNAPAPFVLFGIPEDIGVKANFGRTGTASAFFDAIKSLANMQHNKFYKANNLIVLGYLDVEKEMQEAANLDPYDKDQRKILFDLVSKIDKNISHIVCSIIKAKKIPILVGGGHNNAYGNIKGLALAKGKAVNAINFDAHTDFRIMEGRHSGNGFTYAHDEGFLSKYFIFGLHENYVSKSVFNTIKDLPNTIKFNSYEEIEVRNEKKFETELEVALSFIKNENFGIEIDLDAIPNIYSSAMTNTGFSVEKARRFIHFFGKNKNATYLHICEGAPTLDKTNNNHLTGKLIATMITDFMKSKTL